MALGTPTIVSETNDGGRGRMIRMQFAGDTATPAGGTLEFQKFVRDAIKARNAAASDKNVRGPENVEVVDIIAGDCGQYIPQYLKATDALFIRDGGSATWAEKTGNLSGETFNVTVICK